MRRICFESQTPPPICIKFEPPSSDLMKCRLGSILYQRPEEQTRYVILDEAFAQDDRSGHRAAGIAAAFRD